MSTEQTAPGGAPKGRITVGLHEFQAARELYRSEGYPEEKIGLLDWFWGWIHSSAIRGDMGRVAQRVRYDAAKIPQILRHNYGARIDQFLDVLAALKTEVDSGADLFVDTVVTREIWRTLDVCYQHRYLGMIFGGTGRSKSYTCQHFSAANNHGQTTYVRLRSGCTRTKLVRLISEAIGRKSVHNAHSLRLEEDIIAHFDQKRRRMLILDECNHILRLATPSAAASAFEFIRDLYDCCNASVVVVLTDYDMSAFRTGALAGFFEQLRGRCQRHLEIPDRVFDQEVQEVCAAFVPNPPRDLLEAARLLVDGDDGKIRALFCYLSLARQAAADSGLVLSGKLLLSLHEKHEAGGVWPDR